MSGTDRLGMKSKTGERQKEKRKGIGSLILFLIIVLLISAGLSYCFQLVLCSQVAEGTEDIWKSSLASYWGGIIGGVVSGVLAFGGVFLTIRYYKNSDRKREIATVQPFLLVSICTDKTCDANRGFSLGKMTEGKVERINVEIKNIGNGFANTLLIHTSTSEISGIYFNKVIEVGEKTHLFILVNPEMIDDGLIFEIQYVDSMTNEYIQQYKLKKEYWEFVIECGYPSLQSC